MDNTTPTKKQQVHDLINTLRERSYVVEFASGCAERAENYTTCVARRSADYAYEAAYTAATCVARRSADFAAAAAAYYASIAADSADAEERNLQIDHLKELHARETSQGE